MVDRAALSFSRLTVIASVKLHFIFHKKEKPPVNKNVLQLKKHNEVALCARSNNCVFSAAPMWIPL